MTNPEPPAGMTMHGGYLNSVIQHTDTVQKRYLGAQAHVRRWREHHTLLRLGGLLDVPRVVPGGDENTLVLQFIEGSNGQLLMREGQAELVLRLCGQVLRRLQTLDSYILDGSPAGTGLVIVHGDFGPQNMLFHPATKAISAVIDWEFCHIGPPVDDLAWTEWVVRRHHRDAVEFLPRLFAGYGSTPPWPIRKQSMINSLRRMRGFCIENGDTQHVGLWDERIDEATSWGHKEFRLEGRA